VNDTVNPFVKYHSVTPQDPYWNSSITFEANASDVNTAINLVILNYSTDGLPIQVVMNPKGGYGDLFTVTLPSFSECPNITYNFIANDTNGNVNVTQLYMINVTDNKLPSIDNIQRDPAAPSQTDDVNITADITDNVNVSIVFLNWTNNNWASYTEVQMTKGGNTYNATIPQQASFTTVKYWIWANDTNANSKKSAEFSYTVDFADTQSPFITDISQAPINTSVTNLDEVIVTANITDDGSIHMAWINYSTTNFSSDSGTRVPMSLISTDIWQGTIPQKAAGLIVYYIVSANDSYGNRSDSGIYNYTVSDAKKPVFSNLTISPDPIYQDSTILEICPDYRIFFS